MHDDSPRASQHAPVRRTGTGALDVEYYRQRAQRLRAEVLRIPIARAACAARQLWSAVAAALKRRRARRELASLSERELKDIGLTRDDIASVVDGSYFSDPSRTPRERTRRRRAA